MVALVLLGALVWLGVQILTVRNEMAEAQVAVDGHAVQRRSQRPGVVVREARQDELAFLLLEPGDGGGQVVVGHGAILPRPAGPADARRAFPQVDRAPIMHIMTTRATG